MSEAVGFLYYVMPFVDGESLRERLARSGALPVSDAVRILCEIADALAYAHARGVVHRDVKPDNVMLSGRHALVTDFGVAKAVSEATGREAVTTAGMALGTPAYMAPEQAAADPHVDLRADLYALGCVAYELLTGRPPFTAATPQAVLAAQVTQAPAPLGAQRPGLPSALEQALMRCLAKHPADRPQSAEEVLAALEPFSSPSGSTTPMAMRPPAPLPAFRRGKRVAFAVTALGALVVAGAAALALARRAPVPLALGRATQITFDRGLELEPALSQMASWWPTSSGRRIGFSSMCGR